MFRSPPFPNLVQHFAFGMFPKFEMYKIFLFLEISRDSFFIFILCRCPCVSHAFFLRRLFAQPTTGECVCSTRHLTAGQLGVFPGKVSHQRSLHQCLFGWILRSKLFSEAETTFGAIGLYILPGNNPVCRETQEKRPQVAQPAPGQPGAKP